jgi:hypothetical protein
VAGLYSSQARAAFDCTHGPFSSQVRSAFNCTHRFTKSKETMTSLHKFQGYNEIAAEWWLAYAYLVLSVETWMLAFSLQSVSVTEGTGRKPPGGTARYCNANCPVCFRLCTCGTKWRQKEMRSNCKS